MPKHVLALCLLLSLSGLAQKQNNLKAEPFNQVKDTLYALVDQQGEIINLPGAPYLRKWWPQNGMWQEALYHAEKRYLIRSAQYKDRDCKEKNGSYLTYHPNGMLEDSGYYSQNKPEGTFAGWYEEGEQHYIKHYKNGIQVDTGMVFRKDGSLAVLSITNAEGSGQYQEYYGSGKLKLIGKLDAGQRAGNWQVKREDGSLLMQLSYLKDSLVSTNCFEADGTTPSKGICAYERPPSFPNGHVGWSLFLQKNLRYPDEAVRKNIQGVVRVQFIVDKEGNASEFTIVSSPDKSLSNEVIRLMKRSPKWEPALQLNHPVIYRHIQAITFRLE